MKIFIVLLGASLLALPCGSDGQVTTVTVPPPTVSSGEDATSPGNEIVAKTVFDVKTNLQLTLSGVLPLADEPFAAWIAATVAWTLEFFISNPQYGISDVETTIDNVSQDPPFVALRNRFLQASPQLTLAYDQNITYTQQISSSSSTLTSLEVITLPFESEASQEEYTQMLRDTGLASFEDIVSISAVDTSQIGTTRVDDSSGSARKQLALFASYFALFMAGMAVI